MDTSMRRAVVLMVLVAMMLTGIPATLASDNGADSHADPTVPLGESRGGDGSSERITRTYVTLTTEPDRLSVVPGSTQKVDFVFEEHHRIGATLEAKRPRV